MAITEIEQPNRKIALYEDLKRMILTMRLAPGTDIDEVTLSRQYNLSRTPLREVLRRMAGEGYLVLRDNRGAQVSAMSHKTLRDFFLAAPMIYAAVTRLAAENAKTDQVERLKNIQEGFRRAIQENDLEAKVFTNDQFHAEICDIADNVYLAPSMRRLLIDHARIADTFYRPRNEVMRRNLETAALHHDQMIEAIETGDGDLAAQLAIDHWELSRGQIELFVTPRGLDESLGELLRDHVRSG